MLIDFALTPLTHVKCRMPYREISLKRPSLYIGPPPLLEKKNEKNK